MPLTWRGGAAHDEEEWRPVREGGVVNQPRCGAPRVFCFCWLWVSARWARVLGLGHAKIGLYTAFNKIMKALNDDKVNMVGVWGMEGVGKTTLVTKSTGTFRISSTSHAVHSSCGRKFDPTWAVHKACYVWTVRVMTMHMMVHIMTVRETARQMIVRQSEKTTIEGQSEGKVLVILDDIWKKLNLEKIGIPFGANRNVAKECKGLPVAILTLAKALKGTETITGWESRRIVDIGNIEEDEEEEKNAYMCLKVSYYYLKKETTKRCSLLCALYPENHSIDEEDLVRHAWGLEVIVLDAIKHLKDSCLLLESGYEDEYGKRHVH
ncbi:hypothetical protein GOBAR_AA23144 [Gossypium barbadense]|uniref:NB-ARC domain-containing protein n=1 Tax=Gossypium barbadense TaxID=3634 RepID=A0A2P5X2G6_GOSBA|nr:hypothetical protein GOBAR_AA23144 [Gossypium barbadense]